MEIWGSRSMRFLKQPIQFNTHRIKKKHAHVDGAAEKTSSTTMQASRQIYRHTTIT